MWSVDCSPGTRPVAGGLLELVRYERLGVVADGDVDRRDLSHRAGGLCPGIDDLARDRVGRERLLVSECHRERGGTGTVRGREPAGIGNHRGGSREETLLAGREEVDDREL